MVENLNGRERTHKCGQLSQSQVNEKVFLTGWVARRRKLGNLVFVTLRDVSGSIQVVFNPETLSKEDFAKLENVKYEYVLGIEGTVEVRDEQNVNRNIKGGDIEVVASSVIILSECETLPFMVETKEENLASEELRLKYRYIDLRREKLKNNMILRHKIVKSLREYLDGEDFIEIETPMLGKSTPEGARDYLVPSRLHPEKFYALPQSPQLYKQLLMVGGLDRYYQFSRCFRDEDLRADRQPEFTQIDIEMSFVDKQEQVLEVGEKMMVKMFKDVIGYDLKTPFRRMSFEESMNTYGSDKPDTRYGLELVDISKEVENCAFESFTTSIKAGGAVKAINVKGFADKISRKKFDKIEKEAKLHKAKGLISIYLNEDEIKTSISKFLTAEEIAAIIEKTEAKTGDLILMSCNPNKNTVCKALGAVRAKIAKEYGLIDNSKHQVVWVKDFPLFEKNEETGGYNAMHHLFTAPMDEYKKYLKTDPSKVLGKCYDLVINGYEICSGSIRIHDPKLQQEVFNVVGFTDEQVKEKFGFFVDAFKYGAPPHGGFAPGLDRIVMILAGTENIKDVVAFPKTQNASDLMTSAPNVVTEDQLKDIHIKTLPPKKD